MIENSKKIRLVPSGYQDKLATLKNKKTKLQALLMLDCGLRVGEVVRLQMKHFDLYRREINVESLKKRVAGDYRMIPMGDRVLAALSEWCERIPERERRNPDAYLFPAGHGSLKAHMDRKQVWKKVKKWTDGVASPHDLRHTFATRIVSEGNDIRVAQRLLGHASIATTEIYLHVPQEQLRQAIRSIERRSWHQKIWERYFPPKPIHIIPMDKGLTKYHIGRKDELARLHFLSERKINTLILGPQGIGKSHLTDNYSGSDNIIRIDEMTAINKMLAGWICAISVKYPQRAELLYEAEFKSEIVEKKAIKFLVEDLIALTTKGEWTLIVDDVTRITPRGIATLERLKNHFHIICCARQVEVKKGTFLSNFERIDLKPLPRAEATELTMKLSRNWLDKVEDVEAYKNHIWENTQGVPLFIYEMVERYSKEDQISLEVTKEVRHTAALPEINAAPFVVVVLASFTALRYLSRATGGDTTPFLILAGLGMLFLVFGRPIIAATKRKYV